MAETGGQVNQGGGNVGDAGVNQISAINGQIFTVV